jgi:hypothetical protein
LLTVQERYLWYPELLILLIAFCALELAFDRKIRAGLARKALTAILVLSFAIGPLRALRGHFRKDAALFAAAQGLKKNGQLRESFASCENWAQSAYVAYFLQQPYYGVIFKEPDADEIAQDLNPDFEFSPEPAPNAAGARTALSQMHVDEVLVWPDCPVDTGSLGMMVGESGPLRVVRVNGFF